MVNKIKNYYLCSSPVEFGFMMLLLFKLYVTFYNPDISILHYLHHHLSGEIHCW